jgi:undecaprenyl-diphosphatase
VRGALALPLSRSSGRRSRELAEISWQTDGDEVHHGYGHAVEPHAVDGGAGEQRGVTTGLRRSRGGWLVLVGLFVTVTLSVELAAWNAIDHSLDDWLASHRTELFWRPAKAAWDVADPEWVLPTTLVVSLVVAWARQQWVIAVEAAIRIGLVLATVLLLKPLLAVPGPTRDSMGAHGGAFPSGHTTTTLVCVTLLLAWIGRPRSAAARVVVMAAAVAVVGGSAVYLHYHYVSDVVGGILLGALIATLPLGVSRRRVDADRRTAPVRSP